MADAVLGGVGGVGVVGTVGERLTSVTGTDAPEGTSASFLEAWLGRR